MANTRVTKIQLLDDKFYDFAELPFCNRTLEIQKTITEDSSKGIMDAILFSLSLTVGKEKALEIVESMIIPMPRVPRKTKTEDGKEIISPEQSKEFQIFQKIQGAMIAGADE